MKVLETDRLVLRWITTDDAPFILALLNEPSWLRFIGDKGVRTVDEARDYILNGPMDMYRRLGFGLYLTERKADGVPIGICGLIKRPGLDDVDIGFAFLPAHWSQGYAFESASAVLEYGRTALGMNRIVAITTPDNLSSIKLLNSVGLKYDQMTRLARDAQEVMLFSCSV